MKIRLIFSFGEYDENDLLLIKQKLIEKINFLIKKYNGETIELNNLIKIQRLNKINLISNGDDYQVLFTANVDKTRIIQNASKATGIKITKIGKIVSGKDRSLIFDEKGKQIRAKSKGYIHRF